MNQNASYEPFGFFNTLRFIINTGIVVLCFLGGAIGYYAVNRYGIFSAAAAAALACGSLMYDKIGFVVFGLFPLSIYLACVVLLVCLENAGRYCFKKSPVVQLEFVMEVAPMLGIVGTMVSLSSAMISVDISQGAQNAIQHLTSLVGQALNSSIYGIALAIVAFLTKMLCHEKWNTRERQNETTSVSA